MKTTLTQKLPFFFAFCLVWMWQASTGSIVYAQDAPIKVDLSGQPNGIWKSTTLNMNGEGCGDSKKTDACIQFEVTLDKDAGGLQLSIIGSEPGGAMQYSVNCGKKAFVGSPICVSGVGPYILTLCRPGNAPNSYEIQSTAAFTPQEDISVSVGCSGKLKAPVAFSPTSVTWESLTPGGDYIKYLKFSADDPANPTVTPDANAPAFVDYRVCGQRVVTDCPSTVPFCDIVRVYFYPKPVVSISPDPAIICQGATSVNLTGTVTGGYGEFTYTWKNSAGTILSNQLTYQATAVGTYELEVQYANTALTCEKFAATVAVVSDLSANAGLDQMVCAANPVSLSGAVTAATGGVWSGGAGTFSPSRTELNASYTPTAEEVEAGFVTLTLTSTGNGTCTAVQDQVRLSFYAMGVTLSGPTVICPGATAAFTAAVTGGQGTITYLWNTGETTASISGKPAGTYTVKVSDSNSCTIEKSITVVVEPGPSAFALSVQPSTCGASNGEITVTDVTSGSAPFSYKLNDGAFQSATKFSTLAAGNYTLTVKDVNGCNFTEAFTLQNISGPSDFTASAVSSTCGASNGEITIDAITGGSGIFTYSKDGITFQTSGILTGITPGTHSVTVKDSNGCVFSKQVTVTDKAGPSNFTVVANSSTCGASNGSLTVGAVTGGTEPFTFSLNGGAFQTTSNFTELPAGNYSITVKDGNGCTLLRNKTVTDAAGPTEVQVSAISSTCSANNGQLTVGSVTGGTAPFTYSKDGVNFQTSSTFLDLKAGTYTITTQDFNGCQKTSSAEVTNQAGPTDLEIQIFAAPCSRNDGYFRVTGVKGGTAPYMFSRTGTPFQEFNTFGSLKEGTYIVTVRDANGCLYSESVLIPGPPGPSSFSTTFTPSTCGNRNGEITVTAVSGGTSPFRYSLNGGSFQMSATLANVLAGQNQVRVMDANGCVITKSLTVTDIPGPTDLAATTVSTTCGASNGQLTVTGITGGTAPYTYSSNGINFQASTSFGNLTAGNKTITVKDANGCTFVKSVPVSDLAGPTNLLSTTQSASCLNNDGAITISGVTGGTAPFAYSLNGNTFSTITSYTGLPTGTHIITIKDANGCETRVAVAVTTNVPTAFNISAVNSTCSSSNGRLSVPSVTGGTAPYSYAINNSSFQTTDAFTNLQAGIHTITVKDAKGCSFTRQVTLENTSGPAGLSFSNQSSTCGASNGAITINSVTGGTAPYTYSTDGTTFETASRLAGLAAGTYTLTVKDANGCLYSEAFTVGNIAGPAGFFSASQASTCGSSNGSIFISSVTGGTAPYTYSKDGTGFQPLSSFAGLTAGTYTITVKDANGCLFSRAVVVGDIAGPAGLTLSSTSSTCGNNNGQVQVNGVTGGTSPYTFALDNGAFQSAAAFGSVLAGEHTVTVKDANDCTFSNQVRVQDVAGPSNLAASTVSSTCGASNGTLTITSVTGGTAPYTYSKDGVDFQASDTFDALAAGSHTITVKDANGCTFAKTVSVSDIAGPSALTSSTLPASCLDNDGSIEISGVTGGTAPFSYAINGGAFQSSDSFTALTAGTYTVTAKDANGCVVTASVILGTNVPTAFVSTTVSTTCGASNGAITVGTVTGGVAPFEYSLEGAAFQSEATFTGLAAGNFTLVVRDSKGCTFAQPVQVTEVATVTDLIASVEGSTCESSNGKLTVNSVTGGTAPYSYSLNGSAFQPSAIFAGLGAGSYSITVKDANGCTYSEDVQLPTTTGLAGFAVTAQASTCGGSNGQVTISDIEGGVAPFLFSRDGSTFQGSAVFLNLAAGPYTFLIKDSNGCTFSKSISLLDVAGPVSFDVNTVAGTCSSMGSIVISNVTGGTGPFTYKINGTTYQASATFTTVASGTYTVMVKDANGCSVSKEVTITEEAGISAVATSTTPATCADTGTISVTGTTGGTAPFTYSLDGTNYQTAPMFSALASGSYSVFVKDATGCQTNTSVSVSSTQITAATLTAVAAACSQDNGSITVVEVTGGSQPLSYSIDGTTFQTAKQFTNLAAGRYTITIKDAAGCTLAETHEVGNTSTIASFALASTTASCGNKNGRITVGTITGGQSPYAYSVNGTTFQSQPEFSALAEGKYQVTVKDALGCVLAKEVSVGASAPITSVRTSLSSTGCGQEPGQVVVEEVMGGTAPYAYSLNGAAFTTSATLPVGPGTHKLMVKDANSCTFEVAVKVEQVESKLTSVTHVTCAGEANGALAITTKSWNKPLEFSINNGVSFQRDSVFTNVKAGVYQLVTRLSTGCTLAVGTVEVKEPAPLKAEITALTQTLATARDGSAAITSVSGGTAPYTYQLDTRPFGTATEFKNLKAGAHVLLVKDSKGCLTEVSFTIAEIPDTTPPNPLAQLEIPNGFTPNGDGMNDLWVLKNLSVLYPGCKVTVYNRWGNQVFESAGYQKPWDGTYNGEALPAGTYYTLIELGPGIPVLKKSVTIMR